MKTYIYDTTLRDGAQAEGISFSLPAKLRLAERLDAFGVDYIEGGYPASNEKEMEFFKRLAKVGLKHSRLVAFGSTRRARTKVAEDKIIKGLLDSGADSMALVGKSWKLQVKDVLRTSATENSAMIYDSVAFLKDKGKEVFFDAEHYFDGFKDDPEFAIATLDAAESAGADWLVLCDTNGGCLPHEVYSIVRQTRERLETPLAIHTHDDAGLAVANSLESVRGGAVMVQGTINGFGERCGNADLCGIIPSLQLKMGHSCIKKRELARLRDLSTFVYDLVNLRPDPKAPYVGKSAFSHKAGPHVNAVKKNPRTFEHIEPGLVGNERRLLVSELSGASSVLLKAVELGAGARSKSKKETREILNALKSLENKGYAFEAADASFKILIQKVLKEHKPFFDLEGFRVTVEKRGKDEPCASEATIKVRVGDEVEHTAAEGDGPVNALDGALRKALTRFYPEIAEVLLTDFRVRILDPEEASAATTRVLIESSDGKETWGTVGVSENIIEASWEALVDSVEYKLFNEEAHKGKRRRRAK